MTAMSPSADRTARGATMPPDDAATTGSAAAGSGGAGSADAGSGGAGSAAAGSGGAGSAAAGGATAAKERRDLASRASGDVRGMLRFVVDPERRLVPDLAERLPGRGFWVKADAASVARALKKRAFDRQAGGPVVVPADLSGLLERLLVQRCLDAIGLARRAGELISGFDQVMATLATGADGVLIEASDAAVHGRQKSRAKQGDGPVVDHFTRTELGRALGRDAVVHAWIRQGRLATRLVDDAAKLDGFRPRRSSGGQARTGSADGGLSGVGLSGEDAGGVVEQQGT